LKGFTNPYINGVNPASINHHTGLRLEHQNQTQTLAQSW